MQQAVFKFLSNADYFQGFAYGVCAPALLVHIEVNKFFFELNEIDSWMRENFLTDCENLLFKSEIISELDDSESDSKKLIKIFFFWYAKIHVLMKMPICENLYIREITVDDERVVYAVVFNFFHMEAASIITHTLCDIFNMLLTCKEKSAHYNREYIDQFFVKLQRFSLPGTNTRRLVQAALSLQYPYRIFPDNSLLIGYGSCAKRFLSTTTDETSNIGVRNVGNKQLTSSILQMYGLPTAYQVSVNSLESTLKHAKIIGYPVVLKPVDQDQGRGVSNNIKDEDELIKIYNQTSRNYRYLVLEKHIFGDDYRLTVVNKRVVKIFQRVAGGVEGDGQHTIKELVDLMHETVENQCKYRKKGKHALLLDEEALSLLQKQNLRINSIPKKDEPVHLRAQNNISTGGREILISNEDVHQDNIKLAIEVAELFSLDIAGIDFISENISQSWLKNGAVICEVNAMPQIGGAKADEIYEEILRDKIGQCVSIPIYLIAVPAEKIRDNSVFLDVIQKKGYRNYSIGNYVIANGAIFTDKAVDGFDAAKILLMNKHVDEAYCFVAIELLKQKGLPAKRFQEIKIMVSHEDLDLEAMVRNHTDKIIYESL